MFLSLVYCEGIRKMKNAFSILVVKH